MVKLWTELITLEGDTETTYVICATDKAGNVTEYTIVMKPISSITDTITEITVVMQSPVIQK